MVFISIQEKVKYKITLVGLRMRMTWVTGFEEETSVPEAGIICNWNVFGTAAWKRKSLTDGP